MTIRNAYVPIKKTGISIRNEPAAQLQIDHLNVNCYPDMHHAYQNAQKILNVPNGYDFILGNGCENILKCVLLAIQPQALSYAMPNWGMVHIIAEQLRIVEQVNMFDYDIRDNTLYEIIDQTARIDVCYSTFKQNNFFKTRYTPHDGARYEIIDCSYLNPFELSDYYADILTDKSILIGGFQKTYGCGIRLGYAIFPKCIGNEMHLQRENYISAVACQVLNWSYSEFKKLNDINTCYYRFIAEKCKDIEFQHYLCQSYLTVITNNVPCFPYKSFNIDDKRQFVRIGVATTYQAQQMIAQYLRSISSSK